MSGFFSSGNWQVTKGKEQEFVEKWGEFLGWTREANPGLVWARLVRRTDDPWHFVSMSEWKDHDARDGWKGSEDYETRLGACRALCDEFDGGDYDGELEV